MNAVLIEESKNTQLRLRIYTENQKNWKLAIIIVWSGYGFKKY